MNAAVNRNDVHLPVSWEEQWSACMDGELEAAEADQLLSAWRKGDARADTWRTYHLIGDVLRSPELAIDDAAREHDFLVGIRERLAAEPLIVAPSPLSTPATAAAGTRGLRLQWPHWATWLAASGFVVMAAVAVVSTTGMSQKIPGADMLAIADRPDVTVPVAAPAGAAAETVSATASNDSSDQVSSGLRLVDTQSGALIRDKRLDAYMSAHSQFGASTALGAAGYLRGVAIDDPDQP